MIIHALAYEVLFFGQGLLIASKVNLELGHQVVYLCLDLSQMPGVLLVLPRELLKLLLNV